MVFSSRSHGVFSVVLYGPSTCEKKECALPEEVGEEGEIQERDSNDDKNYEEEEEEEHEGRRKRSKKERNVGESKAADEDPVDVEKYIDRKNLYFVMRIRALRHSRLHVPSIVLSDYVLKLPQDVEFQDTPGRTWRGRVGVWKDGRTWISGWGALCRHNNLKKDNRCICEFLEEKSLTGRII